MDNYTKKYLKIVLLVGISAGVIFLFINPPIGKGLLLGTVACALETALLDFNMTSILLNQNINYFAFAICFLIRMAILIIPLVIGVLQIGVNVWSVFIALFGFKIVIYICHLPNKKEGEQNNNGH